MTINPCVIYDHSICGIFDTFALGKVFCAQELCVMIHFRRQGVVLVARNRLLDVEVEALAIEPEQSKSCNKPRVKKEKSEECIPQISDVLKNVLDDKANHKCITAAISAP